MPALQGNREENKEATLPTESPTAGGVNANRGLGTPRAVSGFTSGAPARGLTWWQDSSRGSAVRVHRGRAV
jgi:hypothetical protein